MMKYMMSFGLVLFGIMTALPAFAGGPWTRNTNCIFATAVGGELNNAGQESCKVKYTPWSIYFNAVEEWDISFGGEVFEIVRGSNGYRMSAESLSEFTPVVYSSDVDGYQCWVSRTNEAFGICYEY